MARSSTILMLAVAAALTVGLTVDARAADKVGESRVKFEKLIEQKVGETEYLGIVVRPLEGGGSATLLFGRKHRLVGAVRKLKKGVVIAVGYAVEDGHKWLTRLAVGGEGEGERRREGERDRPREGEGDRPREGERRPDAERRRELEGERRREGEGDRARKDRPKGDGGQREIVAMLRRLAERLERLERQVRELRAENAQLRKRLGMKGDRDRKREGDGDREKEGDAHHHRAD